MHKSGHCLCGKIKYQVKTEPKWTALCHCDSCRRACSAPIVAWMGFDPIAVEWQGERTFFKSSKTAIRGFCNTCGTQMSFESTRWPGEIHLYAISLEDPQGYEPQLHCYYAERVNWLNVVDALAKHDGFADVE